MRKRHLRITRDTAMFVGGAAMLTYETLSGTDRPNVIYAACTLMGISAYLAGTRVVNGKDDDDKT